MITRVCGTLFGNSGARFSDCERYRYALWRSVSFARPDRDRVVVFVMKNPSTADERADDPTIARCVRRARVMGYDTLKIVNVYAWRSTNPNVLATLDDPVGPDNDAEIVDAATGASLVVCAWGRGCGAARVAHVVDLLKSTGAELSCLGANADGSPKHPLYVPYETAPRPL